MKITFILKGDIRGEQLFRHDLKKIKRALPGAQVSLLESQIPGQSVSLAASACQESDYLIAVGGDGTVNEVLNGCLQATEENPGVTLPTLGILAYGTANDLARTLGVSGTADELVGMLLSESRHRVDVGRLQYTSDTGASVNRYFLNAADIGIGAHVVGQFQSRSNLLGSNLHYLRSILSSFLTYRHKDLQLTTDQGLDWQGKSLALVAANGRYFGSGLCVAPGAHIDDGQLFITLVGNASARDFVRKLRQLKRGHLIEHPEVSYHQAQWIEITHTGEAAPVEADGELLGTTPARMEVVPRGIDVLMSTED